MTTGYELWTDQEIIDLVAINVMKFRIVASCAPRMYVDEKDNEYTVEKTSYPTFDPLNDWPSMQMVIEKCIEFGQDFDIFYSKDRNRWYFIDDQGDEIVSSPTFPRAVCEAALAFQEANEK